MKIQRKATARLSYDGYFIYQRERGGEDDDDGRVRNRRVADERTRQMREEKTRTISVSLEISSTKSIHDETEFVLRLTCFSYRGAECPSLSLVRTKPAARLKY